MSTELARRLRRNSSPPERALWRILHTFRQEGYHFRRQVEIGTYYVDFACHHPALVIEVDGGTHTTDLHETNDAVRDDYLQGRGYKVLRFWNNDVMGNPDGVFAVIAAELAARSRVAAPPTPSLPARGRELSGDRGGIEIHERRKN
ncbi:MAG: endonuclease domain-containing protein [Devosia sp.]